VKEVGWRTPKAATGKLSLDPPIRECGGWFLMWPRARRAGARVA
jgi:hypothetical protein